jgi:circadian clock protein KaiC
MERLTTGVPGLDLVLKGGLPVGAVLFIGGPPGAGKTVLCEQIAFHRAALGHNTLILTTLSEPHDKLIRHAEGFTWFERARLGREIRFLSLYQAIQDGGVRQALDTIVQVSREHRVELLVLDAFRGVRDLLGDELELRRFVFDLGEQLGGLGVTTVLTGEYAREDVERYVEFTVADGIVHLSHRLASHRQTRALEVVKLRGSDFLGGLHTFEIAAEGVSVYPRHSALARRAAYAMGEQRLSTGVVELDGMLGGGLLGHSLNLIVGTPGVGKTLLALHFLAEGARRGERGVMMSLDESEAHLEQKARWSGLTRGKRSFFDGDCLRMLWEPAVETEPDIVAAHLREAIERGGVRRVVLDAMANLEGALDSLRLSDFVISLTNYLRGHEVTVLMINDLPELGGAPVSVGGFTYSATADNMVLMRQVEIDNRLRLLVSVVKMRDSPFDPLVRGYTIEDGSLRIGEPLWHVEANVTGPARLHPLTTAEPGRR